ncbi:MAG: ABC transporter ATP-binding protein [Schleiferilactobacillus harbinensis]|jgi:osmoprotectant transport system ATP-binding protein|nr:ABC transporter ATP-binding protein [Schleiferilactobacillus harbinensis]MCI1913406.1 ABC transporter ATP-binding protein [Schleiferilactobacillus harbinensis]
MVENERIAVQFNHVQKEFADQMVLTDLNLTIPADEIFVLVGPSGSGKTTTLKMINRLEDPSAGEITYFGRPVADYPLQELRWSIGYVLQHIALFPNMTVAENIAVIPEMKKMAKTKIQSRTTELLAAVDLPAAEYAQRYPHELSGGEAQRVGIVRALAADPGMILMDEPFSALDPLSRKQLQELILRLQAKLHKTIVFVTHDMHEALKVGDRIAVMHNGVIHQVGTPADIQQHPATSFIADFFAGAEVGHVVWADTLTQVLASGVLPQTTQAPTTQITAHTSVAAIAPRLGNGETLAVKNPLDGHTYQLDAAGLLKYIVAVHTSSDSEGVH